MSEIVLIGVDGGATEVKAHAVACEGAAPHATFRLRPEAAARAYPRVAGFVPVPVAEQLARRDAALAAGHVGGAELARVLELAELEITQGDLWVRSAVEAIGAVARQCAVRRVLVGIGMPGLKTPDGRGICVINNGPRIPDYLRQLEASLAQAGVELSAPVAALGSDADYCGLGEEYAAEGAFRDVQNAYYIGGGTGIADALKLNGRLVPFDAAKAWIQKSWQMPSALGPTFERLVSAAALNQIHHRLSVSERPNAGEHAGPDRYPEQAACAGDPIAAASLRCAGLVLAELLFERITTIYEGRADVAHRGAAYARLDRNHPFRGTMLDHIVIGQRIGLLYGNPTYHAVFAVHVDAALAALLDRHANPALAAALLSRAGTADNPARCLRPGFLRASRLRAAPALGAAIAAAQAAAPTA